MGLYHGRNSTRFYDVFIRTILGFGLAFVVLLVVFSLCPSLAVWRETGFIGLTVSLARVFLLRYFFLRIVDTDLIARRVLRSDESRIGNEWYRHVKTWWCT